MAVGNKHRHLFSADEWEWFLKLGKSHTDPVSKRDFYDGVIERKLEDPKYSLFDNFPNEESEKGKLARKYCKEILKLPGICGIANKDGE